MYNTHYMIKNSVLGTTIRHGPTSTCKAELAIVTAHRINTIDWTLIVVYWHDPIIRALGCERVPGGSVQHSSQSRVAKDGVRDRDPILP